MQDEPLACALRTVSGMVEAQRAGDENYFRSQLPRYVRTMRRIQQLKPEPCRVLDIGSHYLHQALLLQALGHEMTGIDVGIFTGAGMVKERAARFCIRNFEVNDIETGRFLPGQDGRFDLILFTEVLEHITFNPVRFWQRVYELLSPGGLVYISTPNSMRPAEWMRSILHLLAFRGRGIGIEEIMQNVTYGHHWKEYSAWEIKRYFSLLSPDFDVSTRWYSSDLNGGGVKTLLKKFLGVVPCLRSDIEAVVSLRARTGYAARAPGLPIHRSLPDRQASAP